MNHVNSHHSGSDQILQLLASIPKTTDLAVWISEFRSALQNIMSEVDRVSLLVNGLAGLSRAEQRWLRFFAVEGSPNLREIDAVDAFTPSSYFTDIPASSVDYDYEDIPRLGQMTPPVALIYNRLKRDRLEVTNYHEPLAFEYHSDSGGFLGVIFLWRSLDKPSVSESDTTMLLHLREFITFALEGAIARAELKRPSFRGLFTAMARLIESAELLHHEARVVGYLLLGLPYKQIADRMKISVNTVRKYIKSVYRKAGVHSLNELYARHFLPWPGELPSLEP